MTVVISPVLKWSIIVICWGQLVIAVAAVASLIMKGL